MKINSINNQNFKGVLTKPEPYCDNRTHYDWGQETYYGDVYRGTNSDYYPFIDESNEEIDTFVKENSHHSTSDEDLVHYINEDVVNVKKRIPITKKYFIKYINNELLSNADNNVRDLFVNNKMQMFIREVFKSHPEKYIIH